MWRVFSPDVGVLTKVVTYLNINEVGPLSSSSEVCT